MENLSLIMAYYVVCQHPYIYIYFLSSTENIALERPAKQRGRGTSNTADMAVDALGIQTCARTPPNATGWWRLNLEYQATISRIKLTSGNQLLICFK